MARLRVVLASATLIMLGLSWPLWVNSGTIPRVPFLPLFTEWSVPASWSLFAGLLASVALVAAGLFPRVAFGLSGLLFLTLIAHDQHRFQPWVYQYLMLGALLAGLAPARSLHYARWWFAALYLHSGLSKLDVSFCNEMGRLFLTTLVRPLGLDPDAWPEPWRVGAVLAMPLGEILLALMICVPGLRRWALAGGLLLHAVLLAILGPWGLRHSTIVLVWNLAMMGELWVLLGGELPPIAGEREPWPALVVKAVFWAAVILPLGESWGFCDAWPAHALYASHTERTVIYLHEDELADYPEIVRRHVGAAEPGGWRRLDLTGWSREERGTPLYPSDRACNGVAEGLAARYRGARLIRLVQWGRADRWSGRRTRDESLGLDAIRRQGDRYRLNSHPAQAHALKEEP